MYYMIKIIDISIHAPRGRSDVLKRLNSDVVFISIHAPRGRSDAAILHQITIQCDFNPRSSREERLSVSSIFHYTIAISIHAPRGRSDFLASIRVMSKKHFNPRSSREERRLRGQHEIQPRRISIHAPRGRSDYNRSGGWDVYLISIHAPRGRSDVSEHLNVWTRDNFNPRSSREERLQGRQGCPSHLQISIHAPRGRSDDPDLGGASWQLDFNPRSSREERRAPASNSNQPGTFQSTLLAGGATRDRIGAGLKPAISIHAPRGRSDFRQARLWPMS